VVEQWIIRLRARRRNIGLVPPSLVGDIHCAGLRPSGSRPGQAFFRKMLYPAAMSYDVVDLRDFYAQRLGTVARRFVGRGIRKHWADTRGQRVLGIGYATPYLGLFREEAERCLAFMPGVQGVVKWPSANPTLTAMVDENELPLPDAAVDRVLLVHALEMSHDAPMLLREVWRVLAAGGRLMAVVPNRRGLWARIDITPFGHGRPYSRSQITQLLRETWFTPTSWAEVLYVPPISRGWFLRSAVAWERAGATISAPFAGVHIVEATKQVYRAIPARREKRQLVPGLAPVLEPVLTPSTGRIG
jgi:SAM-dependent methyltransferase